MKKHLWCLVAFLGVHNVHAHFWDFFFKSKAASYASRGQWQEAKEHLNQLLVDNPYSADVLYDLGIASFELKEFDNAYRYFDRASQYTSSAALREQALFNKGNTAIELENLYDALAAYDEVLAYNPDNECAKHNRDMVQKMINDAQNEQNSSGKKQQHAQQDQQDSPQSSASGSNSPDMDQQKHDGQNQSSQSGSNAKNMHDQSDQHDQSPNQQSGQPDTQSPPVPQPISGRHHSFQPQSQCTHGQHQTNGQSQKSPTDASAGQQDSMQQIGDNDADNRGESEDAQEAKQQHTSDRDGDGNEQTNDRAMKQEHYENAEQQDNQHESSLHTSSDIQGTQEHNKSQDEKIEKVLLDSDEKDKKSQKNVMKKMIKRHIGNNDKNMW